MKRIFMLAVGLMIAGVASAQLSGDLLKAARKAIETSDAVFSGLANKNDGSILTRYTDDAGLLPPNAAPVCVICSVATVLRNRLPPLFQKPTLTAC